MKVFDSEKVKEMLMEKIKSREVIRLNYEAFDYDDFEYLYRIFNENNYKCHAYNIAHDEWVPEEYYVPSIFDEKC